MDRPEGHAKQNKPGTVPRLKTMLNLDKSLGLVFFLNCLNTEIISDYLQLRFTAALSEKITRVNQSPVPGCVVFPRLF